MPSLMSDSQISAWRSSGRRIITTSPLRCGVGDVEHLEAGGLGLLARGRVRAEADDHVVARLLEVQRVRVALRAEAEDRDRLALERVGVGIGVVEDSLVSHGAAGYFARRE